MDSVIGFITQNYGFLLFFAVLILLAIIGYFAEKTTNAQKDKKKVESKDEQMDQNKQRINYGMNFDPQTGKPILNEESKELKKNDVQTSEHELVDNLNIKESIQEVKDVEEHQKKEGSLNNDGLENESQIVHQIIENKEDIEILEKKSSDLEEVENSFANNEFDQFSLEFDAILPKKEIIDTDLLSDIDSLELDKTQKIDLTAIPDLDNIDLPKIKQIVEDEDVWKL